MVSGGEITARCREVMIEVHFVGIHVINFTYVIYLFILQKCPQFPQVGLKSKLVNLEFLQFLSILGLVSHQNQERHFLILIYL